MPELRVIDLSVNDAARLLHVQPQTVQRRLRSGELPRVETIGGQPPRVRLAPAEAWIRVEDASALLGVSPATIRSNIARGRLAGRREEHGRWRVLLRSVLEDPRCRPEAVEMFGGEGAPPPSPGVRPSRTGKRLLHRQLNVRLSEEEAELLDRARDRHGTFRAAIVVSLMAADEDGAAVDHAELAAEHVLYREQLERLRVAHRGLRARAEGNLVEELHCHVCGVWVPVEECDAVELPGGGYEIFHEKHGHVSGSRFRTDTGLARRAAISPPVDG
jgi:hypothetical protein